MPEITEEINSTSTIYEPDAHQLGCCTRCDCDISLPDAPHGLCAVCEEVEL
jgi:hypothetical protein